MARRNEISMSTSKDNIYAAPLEAVSGFRFDDDVAAVFPDMINRSVPGYSTIIAMTGVLAGRYAQTGTHCYDLGCSLGATTLAMAKHLPEQQSIIAVDNSSAMIQRAGQWLDRVQQPVELVQADVNDIDFQTMSVAAMNFTLQFIPLQQRASLLSRLRTAMVDGGVLILSEKICFADEHLQTLNNELHHEWKRNNGYSDLEISQKRNALENVLIPETLDTHRQRLLDAGFSSVDVWFQCFNFASLVAIA